MKNLIYTFLFCMIYNVGFSQWSSQSPDLPQKQGVYDLRMAPSNNQVVWSICNNYTIHGIRFFQVHSTSALMMARSTDGGETWQQSGNIVGPMTTSVELIPESLSIIATTRGNNFGPYSTQISHDWGQTWTEIGTTDEFVGALAFANPSTGYGGDWQRLPSKPFNMYKYSGNPISGIFSKNIIDVEVEISPNPTVDDVLVDINLPAPEAFVLLLNDINGRLISKAEAHTNGAYRFDLSAYPPGPYFLTLTTEEGFLTRKILKQ